MTQPDDDMCEYTGERLSCHSTPPPHQTHKKNYCSVRDRFIWKNKSFGWANGIEFGERIFWTNHFNVSFEPLTLINLLNVSFYWTDSSASVLPITTPNTFNDLWPPSSSDCRLLNRCRSSEAHGHMPLCEHPHPLKEPIQVTLSGIRPQGRRPPLPPAPPPSP